MTILQAIILGIIQGITEFLPVSSSGHLILLPFLLQWEAQPLYFDVALHWGTLLAVSLYFWKDWINIFNSLMKDWKVKGRKEFADYPLETRMGILIGIGTIPAVIVGFLLQDLIEEKLRSPWVVVVMLVVVAGLMFLSERKTRVVRDFKKLRPFDALFVGLVQAIALIPGTSRSGITMTAGIWRGLSREEAAKFSFLLSTPVIFGAGVYEVYKVWKAGLQNIDFLPLFVGFVVSTLVGILAVKFLMNFVKKQKLTVFVIYRVILAVGIGVVLVVGH